MNNGKNFSRRDFLKLLSLTPAALLAEPILKSSSAQANINSPYNIIVLVFDAWSGNHLAMNGYPRMTMPNVEKFAERAIVYHNHFSAGSFTVPGTASLLTGLYPWTHRAFLLGAGIAPAHIKHQLFAEFHPDHSTVGYAQNKYADQFLGQAYEDLDTHIRNGRFNLQDNLLYSNPIFNKDGLIAFNSFDNNIFQLGQSYTGSLFLGSLYRLVALRERMGSVNQFEDDYPRGLPDNTEYFLLNEVVDGAIEALSKLKSPSFAYFHFYPPHDPYRPTREFFNKFLNDEWQPLPKPVHPISLLSPGRIVSKPESRLEQNYYDQYLLSWDNEVGRLFNFLDESGLLDKSYVIITADHGEMHERGMTGHMTKMLFDSLMRIPLIISRPGQKERVDIRTNTNSVDILSTLAHLAGKPTPPWTEGTLIPGLGGMDDPNRPIYTLDAKQNSAFAPLTEYSVSMTKGPYRLTRYSYSIYNAYEFYDIANDPNELQNLYPSNPAIALQMQAELLEKIDEVNKPYLKKV
ncbi:MAG: sulfatase-like hydrolase/transferase [Anaerolineales bacterium]